MEYTKASKWPVLDEEGIHVGDIVRQHCSMLLKIVFVYGRHFNFFTEAGR